MREPFGPCGRHIRMRTIRLLLATLVTALGAMVLAPAPAFACSCVSADAKQFVTWADVVVTGIVDNRDPPPMPISSSMDPATYTVTIDTIFKGEAERTVKVRSPDSGASCGLENIDLGERYVVFAAYRTLEGEDSDELWSLLCSGTAAASPALVAEVESVTGPGRPPPGEETVAAALPPRETAPSPAGRTRPESLARPVALTGVLVLVGGGAAAWLVRRRRTH